MKAKNKTVRFPVPLIEDILKHLENTEVSFSEFVIQTCEYALKIWKKKKTTINKNVVFKYS